VTSNCLTRLFDKWSLGIGADHNAAIEATETSRKLAEEALRSSTRDDAGLSTPRRALEC